MKKNGHSKPAKGNETSIRANSQSNTPSRGELNRLTGKVEELTLNIEGLEKERDFYFSKLRDIEIRCQESSHNGSLPVKAVLDILYSTEEGFATPE